MSRDVKLAWRWELEAAERGCADAQHAMGEGYVHGCGGLVQVDHAIALAWFRKAALQGRALYIPPVPFLSA